MVWVSVDKTTRSVINQYGFNQVIEDFELNKLKILQILQDHGYIDLTIYEDCVYDEQDLGKR